MKQFLKWLKQSLGQLASWKDSLNACSWGPQCFASLDADVYAVAGEIAKEAGERAAKLGLVDLAAEALELEGHCDPDVVRSYLAKCIAACDKPDFGPDSGPWTVAQVATRLTLSEDTVRDLEAAGKLTCERMGKGRRALRFWPKDLEDYRQQARGAPALKSTDAKRKRLLRLA